MPDPTAKDWRSLQKWFTDNAAEWGGTGLLLRVIPGPHGQWTDTPPLSIRPIHIDDPVSPGNYPTPVLTAEGRDFVIGNAPRPTAGQVAEGKCGDGTTARWSVFWYQTRAGWDRFLAKAAEAGRLFAATPASIRERIRLPLIDPVTCTSQDAVCWLLSLFCMPGQKGFGGLMESAWIVDDNGRWLTAPINRGQREELASRQSTRVARALTVSPLDDFVITLPGEVYHASASACAVMAMQIPRVIRWDSAPGAPPDETDRDRIDRILVTLHAALDKGYPGFTRWCSIPGAKESDYVYLQGAGYIKSGNGGDVHDFGDPQFFDVWLSNAGIGAALDAKERAHGNRPDRSQQRSQPVEQYVFRRDGQYWHVVYDGVGGRFETLDGMALIATLLARRGEMIPAAELSGLDQRFTQPEHTNQPVLDDDAKAAYEEEVNDLRRARDEARDREDEPETERLEREINAVLEALKAAFGKGGRDRSVGPNDPAEAARQRVAQALRRAYKKFEESVPSLRTLAVHLRSSIKCESRAFCYLPPANHPDWLVERP